LAVRGAVIIIRALEDKAEAFRHETNLSSFTPAKQIQRNLTETVILAHVVHSLAPPLESSGERLFVRRPSFAAGGAKAVEARILCLAHSIIKVKLCGKVPFSVVGIVTTDVVGMEGEEGLVRGHAGCPTIQEMHQEVKLEKRKVTSAIIEGINMTSDAVTSFTKPRE
jgi:hypothetical protein